MPSKSPSAPPPSAGRRIQTRRSGVHGKGVFAVQDLAEGETLIEYKGQVISWKEALRRHPHDPKQPNHTFYFHIDDGRVIDGNDQGNAARWINHSCEPNCEADEQDGRVFIKALRNIAAGEELNYDYGLVIDEKYTPKLLADFPCWCGADRCRGTLLSPKEEETKAERKVRKKVKKDARAAREAAAVVAGLAQAGKAAGTAGDEPVARAEGKSGGKDGKDGKGEKKAEANNGRKADKKAGKKAGDRVDKKARKAGKAPAP